MPHFWASLTSHCSCCRAQALIQRCVITAFTHTVMIGEVSKIKSSRPASVDQRPQTDGEGSQLRR